MDQGSGSRVFLPSLVSGSLIKGQIGQNIEPVERARKALLSTREPGSPLKARDLYPLPSTPSPKIREDNGKCGNQSPFGPP